MDIALPGDSDCLQIAEVLLLQAIAVKATIAVPA
jgi:hypothetical protein